MGERLDVDEVELGLVETEFAKHLMGVQPELSCAAVLAFSICVYDLFTHLLDTCATDPCKIVVSLV